MKTLYLSLAMGLFSLTGYGQVSKNLAQEPDPDKELLTVEVSCGQCNFDLDGFGCDVAVKVGENAYYVDGVGISDYGHPHAKGGFCVATHKAEIQGELIDNRYKITYFKLLKDDDNEEHAKEKE